jgi:hypothetical protein
MPFLFTCSLIPSLLSGVECGNELSMQNYALQSIAAQNPLLGDVFCLKELKASKGYAYLFYFKKASDDEKAYSLLVTLDHHCNLRYIQKTPKESDLLLVRQ